MFHGSLDLDWPNRLIDYTENYYRYDIPHDDRLIFFGYSLDNNSDAGEHYDTLVLAARENGTKSKWKFMCDTFTAQYAILTKQTEISNRLGAIRLEDVNDE